MVGSLIVTGMLLALLAVGIEQLSARNSCTWLAPGTGLLFPKRPSTASNLWPNIIAVALTASPLVVLIIGLGYILNSLPDRANCYIGMTRVMVAMSLDRLLPEWFSKVDEKRHTPVNAHLAYFLASIPVIFLL